MRTKNHPHKSYTPYLEYTFINGRNALAFVVVNLARLDDLALAMYLVGPRYASIYAHVGEELHFKLASLAYLHWVERSIRDVVASILDTILAHQCVQLQQQ